MPTTKWAVPGLFYTQEHTKWKSKSQYNYLTASPRVINPRTWVLRNATNIRRKEIQDKTSEVITRILCSRNHPPLGRAGFIWRAIPIPNQASIGHASIMSMPAAMQCIYNAIRLKFTMCLNQRNSGIVKVNRGFSDKIHFRSAPFWIAFMLWKRWTYNIVDMYD